MHEQHYDDQPVPSSPDRSKAPATPEEDQIIVDEILRQRMEYGESSLEAVIAAYMSEVNLRFLEKIEQLQDPEKMAKAVTEAPFVYKGIPYKLVYTIERKPPEKKSGKPDPDIHIELSILVGQAEKSTPLQRIYQTIPVAKYTLGVFQESDHTEINADQVLRDQRVGRGDPPDVEAERQEIVFKGSGRALMMLTNHVVRDVLNRFPALQDTGRISSTVLDSSYDIDKRVKGQRNEPTQKTASVFKQLGYEQERTESAYGTSRYTKDFSPE
jgi:hypothetical protein